MALRTQKGQGLETWVKKKKSEGNEKDGDSDKVFEKFYLGMPQFSL